jgi:beta-lactamase class A
MRSVTSRHTTTVGGRSVSPNDHGSGTVGLVTALHALEPTLDAFPGVASVWCGPVAGPAAFARAEHEPHYAASTMKVGVMVAAWRAAERGDLDLDAPVLVHNDHRSTGPGAPVYHNDPLYDSDELVWARLGELAPLRWLITRMIVKSSNLATNLVIGQLGPDLPGGTTAQAFAQINQVWRDVDARVSHTDRGIEDYPARDGGISNRMSAADLAALFGGLQAGTVASAAGCAQMLDVLLAQEMLADLSLGLPAGTRVALKNGWVPRERHSAAVIYPADAPPYLLAVCTTGDLSDTDACELLGQVAAASWADRAGLGR